MNHPTINTPVKTKDGKTQNIQVDEKLSEVIHFLNLHDCFTTGCCQGDDTEPAWIILDETLSYRKITEALVIAQSFFQGNKVIIDVNYMNILEKCFVPFLMLHIFWNEYQETEYWEEREKQAKSCEKWGDIEKFLSFCDGADYEKNNRIADKIAKKILAINCPKLSLRDQTKIKNLLNYDIALERREVERLLNELKRIISKQQFEDDSSRGETGFPNATNEKNLKQSLEWKKKLEQYLEWMKDVDSGKFTVENPDSEWEEGDSKYLKYFKLREKWSR